MIEITRHRVGTCDSYNGRPAEYSIRANQDEWSSPSRPCQVCMLGFVTSNERLRSVLLLQSGTSQHQ
jgi:hypothetical protein